MGKKHRSRRAPHRADPQLLLTRLAAALNACERAGLDVTLKHGAVLTRAGYVLPLLNGRWAARTLTYTAFTPPSGPPAPDGDE